MSSNPRTESAFPAGHFYSPVVDTVDLASRREEIWPPDPRPVLGVDWNDAMHEQVLGQWFPRWLPDWDYPESLDETVAPGRYYVRNSQFSWLDARTLYVFLRQFSPRRVIEVGSGYSSLLVADVGRRFLGGELDFTCVEPYPRPFLKAGVPGIGRLIEERVERVGLGLFEELQAGDFLFIDSSHVAKTGSDVNYLMFEVLPRLAPGVIVHIHDIHLPYEYPPEWVLDENRSWNEQYLVRALLMYSTAFRVLFGCARAWNRHREAVVTALAHPRRAGYGGGSLWIERV
jgi:predicted O-methyltransferase YrrM